MADIRIFVSNRIDFLSEPVENPLYVPVRCGAVYDRDNPMNILGDDTGDNISARRMSFSELTVQYWAWKNVDIDYYGLCHYRRYLSFSEREYTADGYNMVHVPYLLPEEKVRFGLLDREHMERTVMQADAVISRSADVSRMPTPGGLRAMTVREWWQMQDQRYLPAEMIDTALALIGDLSPEYLQPAQEYLQGTLFRGNNCFVMKKELFDELCRFEFPILFEIDRLAESAAGNTPYERVAGYVGEILYGVFSHALIRSGAYKVQQRQLVYFRDASRIRNTADLRKKRMKSCAVKALRPVDTLLFPVGSRRRETVKKIGKAILRDG